VVDKELLEQAKTIKIDFQGRGFAITSDMVVESGSGSGCAGCGPTSTDCSS
jgi:hypothetical protein